MNSYSRLANPESNNTPISYWQQEKKGGCECENCIKKNSFDDDLFVVIQGHTNHIAEILNNYKGYKNIVWSLDDDISLRAMSLIYESHINPVVSKKPINSGFGNINLQARSTKIGLEYAKSLGAKYCLKIRSDLVFSPLDKFLNLVDYSRLGFLYQKDYPFTNFTKPFENINQYLLEIAAHNSIQNENNLTRMYISDICTIGPVDDVIDYYDYDEDPNNPSAEPVTVPAEYKFMFNYMMKRHLPIDNTKSNLKNQFNFFLSLLKENDIDLVSLKYDYTNYTRAYDDKNFIS